jgi:UDP-N-acetylglucosamine--N-acetylmuramyl-(pentapeptide) pyrophosphoryl-undecaprenol N-acetylglucosamine transferase
MRELRRLSPALVVGFGGYPSFPAMFAAQLMGIPTLIHEQNTIPGRANRALAPLADCIATSFPHVQDLKAEKTVYVGHPVRPAFEGLRTRPYVPPEGENPIRLLVTGGSQGASVFSTVVPDAIAQLPETLRRRLQVTQQCRPDDLERVTARYKEMGMEAETASFFTDLPERLARAHLAIGRSGASTVIESAMAGVPSIFVPLPHALSDEQTSNAWAMETAGAAIMVKQPSFTAPYLATRLESLLNDPERLVHMAGAARDAGKPHAAENLADLVAEVIEGRVIEKQAVAS